MTVSYQFSFTTTVAAGSFTTTPEIKEVIPTTAKRVSVYAPYRPSNELGKYRYYRRIIAVFPDTVFTDEYGNGDAQFSQQNSRGFTVIIKSFSPSDALTMYNDLRQICKAHPFNSEYDRVELLSFNQMPERDAFYLVGGVRCFNVAGEVA